MPKKNPAAVALGSLKSAAKAAASRRNGRKGGRPRKTAKKLVLLLLGVLSAWWLMACSPHSIAHGGLLAPTDTVVPAPVPPPTPVYVVIGDSIAMGETYQRYTLPTERDDRVFRKDHAWIRADDPTDLYSDRGSFWPLVIPSLPAHSQWVTVGQGGTTLHSDWQPGHVSFDALEAFVRESGVDHVTAFLSHMGANDVVVWPSPLTPEQVFADLSTIAQGLQQRWPGSLWYLADLGAVTTGHVTDRDLRIANIRAGIERAWNEIPTVRQGPRVRDLTPDDGVHFRSDASARLIAERWIQSLTH